MNKSLIIEALKDKEKSLRQELHARAYGSNFFSNWLDLTRSAGEIEDKIEAFSNSLKYEVIKIREVTTEIKEIRNAQIKND